MSAAPESVNPTDIVEALVREYLVRAGCTKSLEEFNKEKVRLLDDLARILCNMMHGDE